MKKHTITAVAVAALLSAGAAFAGEELTRTSAGTRTAAASGSGAEVEFEVQKHQTQAEAEQAGFLREMRVRRRLQERRALRQFGSFYCESGPAIQAALKVLFGVEMECPEPAPPAPVCRYASRVADPC